MQSNLDQKTERMTLFIAPELSTKIRVIAAQQRKTISAIAIEAFNEYLQTAN